MYIGNYKGMTLSTVVREFEREANGVLYNSEAEPSDYDYAIDNIKSGLSYLEQDIEDTLDKIEHLLSELEDGKDRREKELEELS